MRVLMVCFGGWSTSILGKRIEKSLRDRGIEAAVTTAPVELGMKQLNSYDIVLVAPQVRHMVATVQKEAEKVGKPLLSISMQEYATPDAGPLTGRIVEAVGNSPKS